jgi:hypothetical protein
MNTPTLGEARFASSKSHTLVMTFAFLSASRSTRIPDSSSSWPVRARSFSSTRNTDIAGVLVFALILDLIYQLIALHTVYLGEAIFVAIVLAIIPYLLVRTLVTWLIRKKGGNYE